VKQGAGTLILTGSNTHSGGTVVTAGTLVVRNVAALGSGSLEVQAGAKVVLDVGTGTVDITSLVLANGGLVDFGVGKLTAQSGLNRTSILAAINAGKGDGSWNGIAGFTSTVVASTPARTLGWMDNGGSYTVGFAAPGDGNLDGMVDIQDVAALIAAGKYDSGLPADWSEGDHNHDGVVDVADLAELLGTAVLREVEAEVRARAPGKILIAEPWSFRGHVGPELDGTSWTSWDDGFREFLPSYVRGNARATDLLHQMAGLGIRPSARLRYFQSHDDHAWIDRITEVARAA
jgi:autotransporter-associated beta strand protein